MRKLKAVEEARAVMSEGIDWSAWRWLLEKRRVREIADRATAALDAADKKIKSTWPADMKAAYSELETSGKRSKGNGRWNHAGEVTGAIGREAKLAAEPVKEADDKAERCRVEAEDLFEEAERQFSAEMARAGARKALESYDLREAAIRKAEAAARRALANDEYAHSRV